MWDLHTCCWLVNMILCQGRNNQWQLKCRFSLFALSCPWILVSISDVYGRTMSCLSSYVLLVLMIFTKNGLCSWFVLVSVSHVSVLYKHTQTRGVDKLGIGHPCIHWVIFNSKLFSWDYFFTLDLIKKIAWIFTISNAVIFPDK